MFNCINIHQMSLGSDSFEKQMGLISTTGRGCWLFTAIHFPFLHLPASLAGRCIIRLSSSSQYVSGKTCVTSYGCFSKKPLTGASPYSLPGLAVWVAPFRATLEAIDWCLKSCCHLCSALIAWSRTPLSNRSVCPRLLTEQNMKFYCVQHNNTVDLFQWV